MYKMATVKNTLLYDISDVAHQAQTTANSASSTATTALNQANYAAGQAAQAISDAGVASTAAQQAASAALNAQNTANLALTTAQSASAAATQAETDAQAAISSAADAQATADGVRDGLARVYYNPLGSFSAVEFVAACARPKIIGPSCPQSISLTAADVLTAGYPNDWTNADFTLRYSGAAKIVNLRGTHIDWTLTDQSGAVITKRQDSGESMVLYYSPVDGWVSLISQF